ncbi:MAG: LamG-like jellyroll fold domain-containing protein [Pseudomonadota bacterium]
MSLFQALVAALIASFTLPAHAQGYRPDVIEMDGSVPMVFAPDAALTISNGGTIEFWTQPDWEDDPGFDPVILSNTGEVGASYVIAMLADRSGIAVLSGEQEQVFTADFGDGQMHHVALNQFDGSMIVLVDGRAVGETPFTMQDLPSDGLWVGSLDGETSPYLGAIGQLRFWDYVPAFKTLMIYATRDVVVDEHPQLEFLSAMSDFNTDTLLILEAME